MTTDMNRLQELHDAGVSVWLDTLSRDLLEDGDFAKLVDDYAVTGATSNPTIFARAITGSDRYDAQLRVARLSWHRRHAGAVLRRGPRGRAPGRRRSCGRSTSAAAAATASSRSSAPPTWPDDAEGTIVQALDLRQRLSLPNVHDQGAGDGGRRVPRSRS